MHNAYDLQSFLTATILLMFVLRIMILLKHLIGYGTMDWFITKALLSFFQSFLKNRKSRTVLNGLSSDWGEISAWVPQDSILGPLFFPGIYKWYGFFLQLLMQPPRLDWQHPAVQTGIFSLPQYQELKRSLPKVSSIPDQTKHSDSFTIYINCTYNCWNLTLQKIFSKNGLMSLPSN